MIPILEQILEAKRRRLSAGEFAALGQAASPSDGKRFARALAGPGPRVIAEVKQRSPSAGVIVPDPDVAAIAREYRRGGAAAISVVIERDFFGGEPAWLGRVKAASGLPVLMKDFVLDEAQLDWAISLGADAVLLIVAALDDASLERLHRAARERGLAVLVEAHDAAEIRRARAAGAEILGINARNLSTFEVDLEGMARLAAELPADVVRVAESGIRSAADVARLPGFQAFLVGESLLKAPDRVGALRELMGQRATRVKVCGVTQEVDADSCARSGVDWMGLNFSPASPRRVTPDRAASLMRAAEGVEGFVAVFAGNEETEIRSIAEALRPDVLQLSEPPDRFSGAPWPTRFWQAVRVGSDDLSAAKGWPGEALLFDTAVKGSHGGTGVPFDWTALASMSIERRIVIAGGLRPGNVAAAIRELNPWGVDAASGLESAPGIKEREKIEAFVRAVRGPGRELRG